MIARLFKAAATNRVPVLSYIQEASLSSAAGLGFVTAMSGFDKLSSPIHDPLVTLSQSAFHGSMIVVLGYTLPLAANYVDQKLCGIKPKFLELLEDHHHKPAQLAGLATGLALSLALIWNGIGEPGSGPKVDLAPLMDRMEQMSENLNPGGQNPYLYQRSIYRP